MKGNLTDLLANFQEIPSAGCWEKIEMQLPVITPQTPSVDGTSGQGASHSVGNVIFQKSAAFWAKAALISVTTITAGTFAVMSILKSDSPLPPSEPLPALTEVIEQEYDEPEMNVIEENSCQTDKKIISENSALHASTSTPLFEEKHEPIVAPPATLPPSPSETNTASTYNNTSSQSQAATQNDHSSAQNTTSSKSSVPQKSAITPIEKDPVAQQYKEEHNIPISNPVTIEIPNIITPNGDGYNDTFIITGIENLAQNRLTIWDRNRNNVFSTTSYQNNWGNNVDAGTYYYLFEYTINGIPQARKGSVTVVR